MNPLFPRTSIILLLIGPSALLLGCSDSESPPASDAFPSQVGSRWVYDAYDSLTAMSDTVIVEIVDKRPVAFGSTSRVWISTSSKGQAWQYVTTSEDTVFIWGGNEEQIQWLDFTYVFPLAVGETWHASVCGTAEVVQQLTVDLPGDGVGKAFVVSHRGACLNSYFDETREFVPDVGLTSAHWSEGGFGWRNETWRLLEFDLP